MRRIGYRAGVKGAGSLFPRDAVLNLPPAGYSWQLQRLAEMFARSGSYQQASEFVLAATGVSIGKRQLEQITAGAAADAERFCQDRPGPESRWPPGPGRTKGAAATGDVGGRQGGGDAPRGAPRHCQGPGQPRTRTSSTGGATGEKEATSGLRRGSLFNHLCERVQVIPV